MLAPLCRPKWRWSESSKYPAQIMFCTKLRGCLCLNPRPFSEVEIDRTCMFEIRLRTAPEIEMCPVVSTQSKQRAAQCEGRIVGAASCSCWKVHCRALKRGDRSAPTMYYSTLHPTASSTPLPTKLHAGLNCVASSHCHHYWLFGPNTPFSVSNWIALLQIKQSTV